MIDERAIEILENGAPFSELYDREWEEALSIGIDAIKKKKQNKGYWIDIYGKNGKTVIAYRCSECGGSPKHAIKSKFCPNCGAEMRGAE